MGAYGDALRQRLRTSTQTGRTKSAEPRMHQLPRTKERLIECAIMLPDGSVQHGFRSRAQLRGSLGWAHPSQPMRGTRDGFWTSHGRFVSRDEAKVIGEETGQTQPQGRELLSSDIRW